MQNASPEPHLPYLSSEQKALVERPAVELSPRLRPPEFGLHDELEQGSGFNLRDLWRILLKRKWTVVLFTLIVVAAVTVKTYMETPLYQASLTMQIKHKVPTVINIENPAQQEAAFAGYYDFYQTQYGILRSRSLAEEVSRRLAQQPLPLAPPPPSLRELTRVLWAKLQGEPLQPQATQPSSPKLGLGAGAVDVEPVRNSSLVRLSYISPNPQLAALVVNTWAETYKDMNMQQRFGASTEAREFLEEQLEQTRSKLERSEQALVDFAERESIVDFQDRKNLASEKLQALSSALNEAGQARIRAELLHQRMQESGAQGLRMTLDNPVIQQLKQTRAELEAEYQQQLKVYKPAYPTMLRLSSQIDEVKNTIDQEIGNIRKMVEADYKTALAHEQTLQQEYDKAQSQFMGLQNRTIHEYNILQREVDTLRQLYNSLLQRYKEIDVAKGMEANNVSVVDSAEVPTAPFSPDLQKNLSMALMLGLFGGIGLGLLIERLDDTIKHPEELERLCNLPVLGIIPIERGDYDDEKPALGLLAHYDPRSIFSEAYRSLRTALQFSTSEGVPKLLLITSAAAHEGKSTTALSLAIQFAQAGKTVLLIDADLRNPSLHRALARDNDFGLTNYLAGDAEPNQVTAAYSIDKLFFISTGRLPPNPAELLGTAKMVSLLKKAASKFDQVIIDCAPVLGLADALILGNLADATVLVVEAGTTRRGQLQSALKRLRVARTRTIGTLLAKFDSRQHGYGYGDSSHYYYYDYGYGANDTKRLN